MSRMCPTLCSSLSADQIARSTCACTWDTCWWWQLVSRRLQLPKQTSPAASQCMTCESTAFLGLKVIIQGSIGHRVAMQSSCFSTPSPPCKSIQGNILLCPLLFVVYTQLLVLWVQFVMITEKGYLGFWAFFNLARVRLR